MLIKNFYRNQSLFNISWLYYPDYTPELYYHSSILTANINRSHKQQFFFSYITMRITWNFLKNSEVIYSFTRESRTFAKIIIRIARYIVVNVVDKENFLTPFRDRFISKFRFKRMQGARKTNEIPAAFPETRRDCIFVQTETRKWTKLSGKQVSNTHAALVRTSLSGESRKVALHAPNFKEQFTLTYLAAVPFPNKFRLLRFE